MTSATSQATKAQQAAEAALLQAVDANQADVVSTLVGSTTFDDMVIASARARASQLKVQPVVAVLDAHRRQRAIASKIDRGPNRPSQVLYEEFTAAIKRNDLAAAMSAITKGANANPSDGFPLSHAADSGFEDMVAMLLAKGANVHADGGKALGYAASKGHTKIVARLLRAGADPRAGENQALRWAAQSGHAEAATLLLDAGAEVNAAECCALRWAAENDRHAVMALLVSRGAHVRAALRVATRHDECGVLRHFLAQDSRPDTDQFLAKLCEIAEGASSHEAAALLDTFIRERALLNAMPVSTPSVDTMPGAGHSPRRPGSGL